MDPDAVYARLKDALRDTEQLDETDPPGVLVEALNEVYTAFSALDSWLVSGGFKPTAWKSEGDH